MTTFDTLRVKVGRRPITVVELDLDFCSNTYGTAPCTAELDLTGTQKCFNTFKSCQDQNNFVKETKTYKFCTDNSFLPIGENIFPCIKDIDIAPTQLNPRGFSVSASVTVTMFDFPHHDRGIDPYIDDRDYTARDQGSFFGKLRSRNPYLINRVMRVKTGYVDNDRTIYTQSRTYFIDRMEGPDANGLVRIIGKDILRFAEAEKAQAPETSQGLLSAGITNSAVSLTLVPAGIGSDYPTSGTVRIGDELIDYSGKSGDQLTGLTRARDGTAADAHDADDLVQLCVRYSAATIPDILYDLLVNYAGIDSSYIPLTDWETEADTWLGSFTSSVVLSDPTGVKDVVEEILESTGCALWWDEIDAELKFRVIVPFVPDGEVASLNETLNILANSLTVKDLEKERVSRVVLYFNPISQIASLDRKNFLNVEIVIDATSESTNAYGSAATREIFSRWVPTSAFAGEVGARLVARYYESPREITFRVDAKDATLKTGSLVDVTSRLLQRFDGTNGAVRFIVTEFREVEGSTHYEYKCLQVSANAGGRAFLIAADAQADWTSATDEEKETFMFISNDGGFMSDLAAGGTIA